MSLLYKGAIVPENKVDIQEFLDEISDFLNGMSSDSGATGDIAFRIREPETDEKDWEVKVSGQISDGQDNDGNEIWKQTELQDYYFGKTLKDAVEQIYTDFKEQYSDKLP